MEGLGMSFTVIIFIMCFWSMYCSQDNFRFLAFPTDLRMTQGDPHPFDVDVFQCCLVCAKNDTCTSINYKKANKLCEINILKLTSLQHRMQPAEGWKLYEKLPCGIGYMTSKRCRHIQNLFILDEHRTYKEVSDFCRLLGESPVKVDTEKDKADLESDAGLANMFNYAYIWLGNSTESRCSCYRRVHNDIINHGCNLNAAVVCEKH